jgi:hypothetical protein
MEESSTYQCLMLHGARLYVLSLGRHRLGPPDAETERAIEAITGIERLEQLVLRSRDVSSWQELLAPPT